MKKHFLWLVALTTLFASSAFAQYPADWTRIIRTFLDVRGRAVVTDSLRVQGTTKLVGAVTIVGSQTITGLSALDSVTVTGAVRIGGLNDYTSLVSIKGTAAHANLLKISNEDKTARATLDSAGALTLASTITAVGKSVLDSTTFSGAIRIGGLNDYTALVSVKGLAAHANLVKVSNEDGTARATLDSAGALTLASTITAIGKSAFDSVTVAGASRFGGLNDYTSFVSIKGLASHANLLKIANEDGTNKFTVDSTGVFTSVSAARDTFAFATTALTHAIYIPGAASSDLYFISKRLIQGVSTDASVDSLSWQYMAKPDSLIVVRPNSNIVSGAKGSYFRIK